MKKIKKIKKLRKFVPLAANFRQIKLRKLAVENKRKRIIENKNTV